MGRTISETSSVPNSDIWVIETYENILSLPYLSIPCVLSLYWEDIFLMLHSFYGCLWLRILTILSSELSDFLHGDWFPQNKHFWSLCKYCKMYGPILDGTQCHFHNTLSNKEGLGPAYTLDKSKKLHTLVSRIAKCSHQS